MKTLGRIFGAMMMADGSMLVAAPRRYLQFWSERKLPAWMRQQVDPYRSLPDASLRWLGAGEVMVAGLLLALAGRAERRASH